VPIQTVKHVRIQNVKNVPIHTEKMVPTLKTTKSIQTNVEIPKKIFSENQNAVKDAKINYSSGVKQNHQITKKKKNLFNCHPYTIFGNFASDIKGGLRKYDNKKNNTIFTSPEMDEWFDNFLTILRIDPSDFDNYHKPDGKKISKMIHFP
jgi:hypothetical protein